MKADGFYIHEIEHVSASSLNLWAAEPALWVLERLLKVRSPVGNAAHLGTATELAVEQMLLEPNLSIDKALVIAVDKAIREANLGLQPTVEGQILRIRMPELNEQRRKELVKVAHKYAEEARVAVRHVRRDGLDVLKKLLKDKAIPEDDEKRHETDVQKATDETIKEIDAVLATKEKEIMQV